MENILVRLTEVLPPHIIAALIGSVLGCWGNADKQLYGTKLSFIMGVLTVSGAGALADFLDFDGADTFSFFFCFLMGGFVGFFGMSLLDALRIASPPFTAKLVKVVSDTLLTQIVSLVVEFFEMIRRKMSLLGLGLESDTEKPQVGEREEPYPSVSVEEDSPPYTAEQLEDLDRQTYRPPDSE